MEEEEGFEDALDELPCISIPKTFARPTSIPLPSMSRLDPCTSSTSYTRSSQPNNTFSPPSSESGHPASRRDRLRGLRSMMKDDFGGKDGGMSTVGDGDALSLISETTSLHSWHRKVLSGPTSIVHPMDSISTYAMNTSATSVTSQPSPSYSSFSPIVPERESVDTFVASPTSPPPSFPPPPLPQNVHTEVRTPPPVPPRNPSIRLPKPLPTIQTTQPQENGNGVVVTTSNASLDSEKPEPLSVAKRSVPSMDSSDVSVHSASNGDVQPTIPSVGRRRGHAKTNSLDRGLTLAKSIKTGPFPPPSNKSNSLTRGQGVPVDCEGEEEERNQQAEGVIYALTTSILPEHSDAKENGTTGDHPSHEDIRVVHNGSLEAPAPVRRLCSISREARKSETIVEETVDAESPTSAPLAVMEPEIDLQVTQPCASVSCETVSANPLTSSDLSFSTSRLSDHAFDPITRDVERRMSMKGHGQVASSVTSDDNRSEYLNPTSKMGYAKSVVKGYASGFIRGALSRATHVLRPSSALKNEHDESASDSDEAAEQSTADTPVPKTQTAIVRPKNNKKGPYDFENMRVAQELKTEHTGAVWCIRFSVCGRLMATAGQDAIIRIWASKQHIKHFEAMRDRYMKRSDCPPQEIFERAMQEMDGYRPPSSFDSDVTGSNPSEDDSKGTIIFMSQPFAVFKGHTADVLDLSWSKNNFVLSSGMDRTVKLWHITRTECLCCFQHVDFVTCVAFLPKDDRYFLSGSLDGKLRLWHIPDKKVALWNEVQVKFITALTFVKNGKFAVVGTYNGRCYFYTSDQLKYHTVVDARSTRGKNARGHKVTGLDVHGDKLLVTSNDSRIRMYDVRDMSLTCKFIGTQNEHSQIRAAFSPDGKHVVCGSEDKFVYMWRTGDMPSSLSVRKDRNALWERARTHTVPVCVAVFAPKPNELLGLNDHKQSQQQGEKDKPQIRGDVVVSADLTGCIKILVSKTKKMEPGRSSFFNGASTE